MANAVDPLAVLNEPLLESDVILARAWWRRGTAAIAKPQATVPGLLAFGAWLAIDAYKGTFGLLSGGSDFPGDAKPVIGVALMCVAAIAVLLLAFLLPRWEPPIATKGALRHLPRIRSAIFAVAILGAPWLGIAVPLVALVPLIAAGVCAQCDIETGGVAPGAFLQRLVPQGAWAFVSIFWLVLWCDIWLHVVASRLPDARYDTAPLSIVAIVLSGCVVQEAMRLRDRQAPLAGLACVAAALCLSNPGIPGLVGGALYGMKAGGGAFDVEASTPGRALCDMGALGQHFHVLAGEEGCSRERANRLLARLRAMPDRERVAFLSATRVQPASANR